MSLEFRCGTEALLGWQSATANDAVVCETIECIQWLRVTSNTLLRAPGNEPLLGRGIFQGSPSEASDGNIYNTDVHL